MPRNKKASGLRPTPATAVRRGTREFAVLDTDAALRLRGDMVMREPTEGELAAALEALRFWLARLIEQALDGKLPRDGK